MSDNKPPMTVVLNNMGTRVVQPGQLYDRHIYVHLDQFLDEVERLADEKHQAMLRNYGSDYMDAVLELAREIQERQT